MLKSVMQHDFSMVPSIDINRSSFNRDCGVKTTFDSGYLVPFYCDEVLPGDTFNVSATLFARLTTPVVPVMDNIFLDTFFFFVPCRLLWNNWKKFMGEQEDPGDSIDYLVPQIAAPTNGFGYESLFDYMGIPPAVENISVNALYFRAYNFIWNEWFRDENLQNSVTFNKDDGPDSASDYTLLRRGKRHDYFTSCLPWPQKGPGVELPLGGTAPVYGNDVYTGNDSISSVTNTPIRLYDTGDRYGTLFRSSSTIASGAYNIGMNSMDSTPSGAGSVHFPTKAETADMQYRPLLYADLENTTAATINSLRQAFQLQKFYEKCARSGTRYCEIIRGHFSTICPDYILNRPEYLGGSSDRIIINPVVQNSATDSTSPQGNLAAFGVAGSSGIGFNKSFTEHGIVIGLLNVRADLTYQNGIAREFSRRTRFDYYWPSFAHLGEQAVLNKEIYAQGTSVTDSNGDIVDDKVFGYQERYAEYRYKPSLITGKLRSSYSQSLDVWHLSQKFTQLPELNGSFIQDNPPIDRVLAVQNEPQFILDGFIKNTCVRPMPTYSVPGLIDHF